MCFVADDGYCTVWEEKTIKKSRKDHKCGDCFGIIPAGSAYRSVFTVFQGDAATTKICPKCQSLREAIILVELGEGCSRSEAEPLLGAMFDQLQGGAEHYYDQLIAIHRRGDAEWLAHNCHLGTLVEAP